MADETTSCSSYQGQDFGQPFDCTNPSNQPNINLFNEVYAQDSKCFFVETSSGVDVGQGRCYKSLCVEQEMILNFNVGGEWLSCASDFETLSIRIAQGAISATVTCPRLATACPELFAAPTTAAPSMMDEGFTTQCQGDYGCYNGGVCTDQLGCVCPQGFEGQYCQYVIGTSRMPSTMPSVNPRAMPSSTSEQPTSEIVLPSSISPSSASSGMPSFSFDGAESLSTAFPSESPTEVPLAMPSSIVPSSGAPLASPVTVFGLLALGLIALLRA